METVQLHTVRSVKRDAVSGKPASATPWRDFLTLIGLIASFVVSAGATFSTIRQPVSWELPRDASPLGYTVSLSLFLVPIAMLAWWFWRHPEIPFARRAFWRTMALLVPLGFILDFLLASVLLRFDTPESTLGWCIPVLGGCVPVEELVFYFSGFVVVLLTYVWADEHWFALYNVPDYEPAAGRLDRILRFDWRALPVAVALAGLATGWSLIWGSGNLPLYFYFLLLSALVPTLGLLRSTIHFVNWRAFSFTLLALLLVSLLWEVSLAMPYGWWGYEEKWMLGPIDPWWGLPIEAVLVWLVVTYTTVVTYEAVKVWQASGRSARAAWLGR